MNYDKPLHDLAFYRFVIDNLPTAVLTVSSDFKITGFNPCAEKMTGYTEAEAVGRFCGDILQCGMCRVHCPLRAAVNGKKPVSLVETTIRNKRREIIPVRISTAGLFDSEGQLIGGVESFQDISRLKALEREKDNLISMLAHDMKSSLAIIGGFARHLLKKQGIINQVKQNEYLGIVRDETERFGLLIENLLEFSRLQAGKIKPKLEPTSLDNELRNVVYSHNLKASEIGVKLKLEMEHALPMIQADASKLHRVFVNLLDNALKFSKENGKVTVTTAETPTEVMVRVEDEGTGIPPDEVPYIFDAFHRGADAKGKKGFGLGLAAVKTIIEAHGGRVRVDSEPGKGSAFTVFLPKPVSIVPDA